MKIQAKKNNLMTEGNIVKQILFFSIPLIFGNLLQQLYNTADSIIVGNYVGSGARAAVGASTPIIYLLIAFSQGAAVGAGVIVSQYLGAKNKNKVQEAVHTSFAIALIIGLVLTVGGVLLSRNLIEWMHTPQDVYNDSVTYMQLYSGGLIFNVIYNMASGILNSAGNSKRSLMYLAIASITNIVLDFLFICGLGMGVAGAAIATDISQILSSVLAMAYLMRVNADYRVHIRSIRVVRSMAARIIRVGLPTGIQNMTISLSNVLVQAGINRFGSAAMAGFGAYLKIDGFNILPVLSFSMAVTTFTGQNIGAGKIDRVKKGMWVTLAMGFIYTVATGILILVFADPLMHLFTSDPDVVALGKLATRYFCPFYFVISILQCLAGTVRGAGKSVPPMVILLTSMCLFRIVWIEAVLPTFDSITGLYILYPVSWFVGVILMILYTWKGKWLDIKGQ